MKKALILFSLSAILSACGSESKKLSNLTAAAFAGDGIFYDKPEPEHDYQPFEFYFKHCSLMSRKPYVTDIEYDCTGPY